MNDLLNQLFATGDLRFGEGGVHVEFARDLPPWGWALIVLSAIALAAWSYSRLEARRAARIALATLRAILLILLASLIAGPRLVRPNETVERDWVVVLADRSGSMQVADAPAAPGEPRITRDQELRRAITRLFPALRTLHAERELLMLGFDAGAYPIRTVADEQGLHAVDIPDAGGTRTSLGPALAQALDRVAARPVAGIVVLTDGRTSQPPDKQLLRRLQADRIPIYALPLGSPEPLGDLAIARAEAPTVAFVRDIVPVQVRVERRGTMTDADATIELIDDLTGRVLETRSLADLTPDPNDPAILTGTLAGTETDAGARTWSVRLASARADLVPDNNTRSLDLEFLDRPIRTVYFDGYPRWEYRYLKNLLLRESSITASNLLLAIDRRYLQEGDELLRALPRSAEEWAPFDVVLLGDLRADLFTTEQLQQLREHVAVRGGGLLWVAGPGATPSSWRKTPLADLLPFATSIGPRDGEIIRAWDRPVVVRPTPVAERLGLLNLAQPRGWPQQLASPDTGWSLLHWAQRLNPAQLKPSTEVLAEALPADGSGDPAPLVLTMRYGAGRVIYVATDETWRWRYARGETLQERFWLPLVRLLARESVGRTGLPALLEVSQTQAPVDQPIRIAVRLVDQSLADAAPQSLRIRIVPVGEGSVGRAPIELRLQPEFDGSARAGLRTYSTTWVPSEPGDFRVEASDPLLAAIRLEETLSVQTPEDEMRYPETDHALLADLCEATGGRVLAPDDLDRLAEILPNRELRIVAPPTTDDLWDTPLALGLILTLACLEWIGRKLVRLI